jgi:hypothetical protein
LRSGVNKYSIVEYWKTDCKCIRFGKKAAKIVLLCYSFSSSSSVSSSLAV